LVDTIEQQDANTAGDAIANEATTAAGATAVAEAIKEEAAKGNT